MKAHRESRKKIDRPGSSSQLIVQVEELAEVLRRHDLSEIEIDVEVPRARIRLSRSGSFAPAPAPPPAAPPAPTAATAAAPARIDNEGGNTSYITSPFVGTFYRSPGPDAAPFVDVGTRVRKGQVLCIVEAMKLMNEIESEVEGTIVQMLVENGHAVEYGEPLFKIKQG